MRQTAKSRLARRRRKIAAWLGILVLALPMLAPIAQGIPLYGASDDMQTPFYLVLCKAMQRGISGPAPSPDQNQDQDQDQNQNGSDCPVCLSFSFGKSVLFTPLAEPLVCEIHPFTFVINTESETGDGRHVSRAHARAPPLSV